MFDTWKENYNASSGKTILAGWGFGAESDCRAYLASRVKAKIREFETAAHLQNYLVEMADTQFDTSTLQELVAHPPQAKDWEVGEAFANVMLEDRFEASFPWPTAWDKRTPKASLPGPDMPGFHRKTLPRFLFGEVKSSSEAKSPPQVVSKGDDCLSKQMTRLLTSSERRLQLIGWLLVRARDSSSWKPIFDQAMKRYVDGDACICGVLVRGGTASTADDLSPVQDNLAAASTTYDTLLLAFYLPFDKSKWVELVYGTESTT